MFAIDNKNNEIAKLLITDPRTDLNVQNNLGDTALIYCYCIIKMMKLQNY